MLEVTHRDRIGESRQIPKYARYNRAHTGMMPIGAPSQQRTGIYEAKASQAIQEQSLARAKQGAFALPGQPLEMLDQLIELKKERSRIRVVQQYQVINRRNIGQKIVSAAVGQCAVGDFQDRFQYAGII